MHPNLQHSLGQKQGAPEVARDQIDAFWELDVGGLQEVVTVGLDMSCLLMYSRPNQVCDQAVKKL
jgi:hypothetical protein